MHLHSAGGFIPPPGLLSDAILRAPRRPLLVPGVAEVIELPVIPLIGPGPRPVRRWEFRGRTDWRGRIDIPLWAAISIVQTPSILSANATTGASRAFASNVTAGNAIILTCAGYNDVGSGALPTSISDTLGNTYNTDVSQVGGFLSFRVEVIASASNISGGADTVSISWGAGANYYVRGVITEAAGLATSSMLDATNKTTGNSTGPTLSVTTTAIDTLVVGHMGSAATTNRTVTATTGTELGQAHDGSAEPIFSAQYLIAASAGSKTHTWTVSSSAAAWAVLLAAYKAAGGAPASTTTNIIALDHANFRGIRSRIFSRVN